MMRWILFISFLLIVTIINSQNEVKNVGTEIKLENNFDLSIVKVYPDSFPLVSVIFQAKNEFGEPLWQLDLSDVNVSEDYQNCELIRLFNISKNQPLNIALVFDHSGSMVDDPLQRPDSISNMQDLYFNDLPLPDGYEMPISFAKKGIVEFLKSSKTLGDSLFFVGFSSLVDSILPLSDDLVQIENTIDSVYPSGSTAFFDAVYRSIDSLSSHNSKGVVVALTDGLDNMSRHSYEEVIEYAKLNNIALYTIGLGDANQLILKEMSDATNGFFYYTQDSKALVDIYKKIKKQLKSIYQLDYTSSSLSSENDDRSIVFSMLNDTLSFSPNSFEFQLPEETILYLKKKENDLAKAKANRNMIIGGAAGLMTVIGISAFVFVVRRKKKRELLIKSVAPNPFQNNVSIKFKVAKNVNDVILNVYNSEGVIVNTTQVYNSQDSIQIDIDGDKGVYIFRLTAGTKNSNSIKAIKR